MKKNIQLFNVLYVIPFIIAVVLAFIYLIGGWEFVFEEHGPDFYLLPQLRRVFEALCVCVIGFVILSALINLITKFLKRISNPCIKNIIAVSLVFLITVGIRVALIYVFQEDLVPFSDFEHAWNWGHGIRSREEYYILFPAYLNYASYIELIVKIFGDSYVNILYMNTICSGITSVFIYFLAKEIKEDVKFALTASALFSVSPSNIYYNTVGTPEFPAIMFLTLGIFFLIKSFDCEIRKKFILLALAGVTLGIGSSFKSFGSIIIIAYSMIVVSKIFFNARNGIMRLTWKKMGVCVMGICCVMLCYGFIENGFVKYTEKNFEIHFEEGATQHFLTVGLNRQGEGQIHVGDLSRKYYEKFVETRGNADEATQYAYNLVIEDWKNNLKDIPTFLVKKLIWTWQDDMMPICYFNSSIGLQPDTKLENVIYKLSHEYIPTIAQLYYFVLMFFGTLGACTNLKGKSNHYKLDFCYLIILGYFGMMILIESQSRYKILIFPIICILAAVGMFARKEDNQKKENNKKGRKCGETLYNNTGL